MLEKRYDGRPNDHLSIESVSFDGGYIRNVYVRGSHRVILLDHSPHLPFVGSLVPSL